MCDGSVHVCVFLCMCECLCACEYLKPMVTICDYHQLHIVKYIFPFFCNHLEVGGGKGCHSGGGQSFVSQGSARE